MLLQVCNVLNVPLEQAEDVIHSAKQPGQDNKALSQVNVIKEIVWQLVPDNERIIGINHDSRQVYFFDKGKMILSKKKILGDAVDGIPYKPEWNPYLSHSFDFHHCTNSMTLKKERAYVIFHIAHAHISHPYFVS